MFRTRVLALTGVVASAVALAACGSSGSGGTTSSAGNAGNTAGSQTSSSSTSGGTAPATIGNCKITSKPNSIKISPVTAGTLTVETTLPAQGWWNGTTPESIKDGYEYCMGAELANMAGLKSVTVKNVSFDQLVAGRTHDFDIALAEISITPERKKVVDFSTPYFDSNIGVLVKSNSGITADNIKSKRCAAYSGTTSVDFLRDQLKVSGHIYPNSQTLYQSVISGQSDAAFLDTAIVLAEAKASNGTLKVVGQYKTGETYGAIYPKGSSNEQAFDQGIKTLISDGTLKNLSTTYLGPAFGGDPSAVPVWQIK